MLNKPTTKSADQPLFNADYHAISISFIRPSFYQWQKLFFENGAAAFERTGRGRPAAGERKIAALEEKLRRKNEVVAELMEEHLQLKKELGDH